MMKHRYFRFLACATVVCTDVASAATITDLELIAEGVVILDFETGSFVSTATAITFQTPGFDFVSQAD